jgi:hypothetical protein
MAEGTIWTDKRPTPEDLIEKFDLLIWSQVHEKANKLADTPIAFSHDERNDVHNDVVLEMLKHRNRKWWTNYSYMMEVIKNAVSGSIDRMRGEVMKSGKRKTEYFESIDAHTSDSANEDDLCDGVAMEIIEKSSTRSNVEETLTVERVRARLSGRALEVFDWVLNDREDHTITGLSEHCRELWGVSEKTITRYRQQIADAMHAEGMALNYPSPIGDFRRLTQLQRQSWLETIRGQRHSTLEQAADANDVWPNQLNYHCKRLYGKSFSRWNEEAA